MSKKLLRGFLAVVVVLVVFTSSVCADVIHLKSGGKLEGKIVKQDASSLTLKMSYGEIRVKKSEITSIVKSPFAEPPKLTEREEMELYLNRIKPIDEEIRKTVYTSSRWWKAKHALKDFSDSEYNSIQCGLIESLGKEVKQIKKITPPKKLENFHHHLLLSYENDLVVMRLFRDNVQESDLVRSYKEQVDEREICERELDKYNLVALWMKELSKMKEGW